MSGCLQRATDVLSAPLQETLLIMSLDKGRYFKLNAVGRRIWELLEHPTTEVAMLDALASEYDVAPDLCRQQLTNFLDHLRERGLVREFA